ncbi:hypothetical protein [Tuwongella immobilis]|uniref:DnaJ-class molecular chaperone with C-terminal Zn finger domain n=1 Tax=Tuwongella immobilis TaxID=692036 RepID=A0A6C2YJY5_9BACT|nr:hypothetical protein [Tuwongella immobilis]VIP01684.1 DnaJ-class molecular chaperone with C-terminal Zn finger domain OS=Nostoc sp. (strain ATCC 29411 / PCC 7524) GN=Nos7524_1228 PE=4 SV=1 [Tuwongella immobilis]VTR99140.1 DnaJ-class molecular chaperone with C-terminal Zn finger domain OS=Nostoc sp. (strain ATCC 29411 / PCC 7524) GN=Nos7524_1228 PE=4 SV=1 [Tuwongella immobilis]
MSNFNGYMSKLNDLIAKAIEKAASSSDILSSDDLAVVAKKSTIEKWRRNTIRKVTGVGFVTGIPGGLSGGLLAVLDLAYLFAAAGRGCYGLGYILNKEVDREKDIKLILACWSGAASAVPAVTAGKIGIKVFGKAVAGPMAGMTVNVVAKAAFKGGSKILSKVLPQITSKMAGQMAGKGFSMFVPLLGGAVSAGVSYWVASSLMNAAELYYQNECVEFNDSSISFADVVGEPL